MLFVDLDVESAKKVDRLEVFVTAELVGQPLTLFARVVEVEHRRHRIDAQPVGVVAVQPAQGAAEQEPPDLVAPVVEDRAAPVGMHAKPRVGVLVEVRAVEVLQPKLVGREVRRHPVEDHADAVLVQVIDQEHEVLRRAVAAGRREISGHLVAPRAVKGVLRDGHELDVREAQSVRVVGQVRRELAICEPAVVLLGHAHPRAEMDFVDRPRRLPAVGALAAGQPLGIAPAIAQVPHDRGLAWRLLREHREGIRLVGSGARDA